MSVKAARISRRFKEKWALRDVSFEAVEGRVTGVCGPAGSGKSVFLRILSGTDTQFSGELEYAGLGGSGDSRSTLLVGGDPVNRSGFWPFWSGTSPRRFGGELQPSVSDKVKSSNARVVLIDDALCRFDAASKRAEFRKLRAIAAEQQKAIIFATASFEDAVEFCDEIVLIDHGEILQTGTPESIYLEPESAVVARFTGRSNVFEARRLTSSKADVPEFQTIAGSFRLSVRRRQGDGLGALNQNVLLAVRPEHISISFGASFPEDNLIKARITGVRFLGPNTLVELDANGLLIEALVMRLVGLSPGDECMLGMPPDRIRIFA